MSLISKESPLNDFFTHESYILPQPVEALPIKRLFDYKLGKLKESTKLPREFKFNVNDSSNKTVNRLSETNTNPVCDEVIMKIKIIGINYNKDFQLLESSRLNPKLNVVPGNKIIGKITLTLNHPRSIPFADDHSKYIVFPYSNCIIQQPSNGLCSNCYQLSKSVDTSINQQNYNVYKNHQCLANLEYGYTIDGGLQDYIKIKNPTDSLIKIPDNVSLHDSCFLMEIMLPFYSFLKDNFGKNNLENISIDGRILVILNNVSKEINDILIVLKHFKIDQKLFWFIDEFKIKEIIHSNSHEEKSIYTSKFNHVLVFKISDENLSFAMNGLISTGLESTKLRYTLNLFDQYNPEFLQRHKNLDRYHADKTIHHFKLSYKDKLNTWELLQIISNLNLECQNTNNTNINNNNIPIDTDDNGKSETRPSVTSIETTTSTFSNMSIHLNSTSNTTISIPPNQNSSMHRKPPKNLRFRDDESIIINENKLVNKIGNHYSWLSYDKDFDLGHDQYSDDDIDDYDYPMGDEYKFYQSSSKQFHTVKQMNRLIQSHNSYSRVCYSNKSNKPTKINAFIFP